MILAGDIGGTKTILALYEAQAGGPAQIAKERYFCGDYEHLHDMIWAFIATHGGADPVIDCACIGVAGPIKDNRCVVTNLPWIVDARELGEYFGINRVELLNDLEAIACAVPHLQGNDLEVLNEGSADPAGVIGVVAPGTGLGEAYLTCRDGRYTAHPCEGGHTDFAANSEIEFALRNHLAEKYGHVSYERVASGGGIAEIYEFLRESGRYDEPEDLRSEIEDAGDPAPVIQRHLSGTAALDICVETMRIFVVVLGAEVGNVALKLLARGGLYLAGGIPPKILPLLRDGLFMESVLNKGRMSELVQDMPICVVVGKDPGLRGAAMHAFELLNGEI